MKVTIKQTVVATVATLTLIGCGGGDNKEEKIVHPYDAPAISQADKNAYLSAVNGARSVGRTCGDGYYPAVAPVVWNDALYKASYEHTEDMSVNNHFEHYGSGQNSDWTAQILEVGRGSEMTERVDMNGYTKNGAGENIAEGFGNLNSVMNAWLASTGHCINIMGESKTDFGMAKVGNYWTQLFGY